VSGTDPQIRQIKDELDELREWRKEVDLNNANFWRSEWRQVQEKIDGNYGTLREMLAELSAMIRNHINDLHELEKKTAENSRRIYELEIKLSEDIGRLKVRIAILAALGGTLGAAGGETIRALLGG